MTKVKVLQVANIYGVDRAIDDVVEVAEDLAVALIRDGVVMAHTEEAASSNPDSTNTAAPAAASEGEAASA